MLFSFGEAGVHPVVTDSAYLSELRSAMSMLGADDRTVFLGQAVACPGTYMSQTLDGVPLDKRIEMPVAEEMQMGATLGLALAGQVPISIFPRWNFLILATNQLVNHLDKIPLYSDYRPHAIIRVGVGSSQPLHPGPQHVADFTEAFMRMFDTVQVMCVRAAYQVDLSYRAALSQPGVHLIVEYADLYND